MALVLSGGETNMESNLIVPGETAKPPQVVVPFHAAPKTPEQAAKGEKNVTMIFEVPVHLTVDTNQTIFYPRGIHPVPARFADHWYLKAHGVKRYVESVQVGEVKSSAGKGKK
jgi:hypothetical protein